MDRIPLLLLIVCCGAALVVPVDADSTIGDPAVVVVSVSPVLNLTASHGPTWIEWRWNAVTLRPGEHLIGRCDNLFVFDIPADAVPPTSYALDNLSPSTEHDFQIVVDDPVAETISALAETRVTTPAATSLPTVPPFVALVAAVVLALVGAATTNRHVAAVLLLAAALVAGATTAATASTNALLAVGALAIAVLSGAAGVYLTIEIIRDRRPAASSLPD